MHIEKLSLKQEWWKKQSSNRPLLFQEFIGQDHILPVLQTAIKSAQKNDHQLWHILLSGPSGYGKTTLAQITASVYGKQFHIITGYAISKPAELISIMTAMNEGDILFIDEIHRLKPVIEEMLYIAMEDFAIDMVMGDGWSVRVPLKSFTLIWATTKPESLSEPLKNRFIYNFHCMDYTPEQKLNIVERYLKHYSIIYPAHLIEPVSRKVDSVPRRIHNLVVNMRDYLISHYHTLELNDESRSGCEQWLNIADGGLTPIHQQYLHILSESDSALGLKTISLKLGINEESVENEIEPLLLKSGLIEKTSKGRIIK